MVNLSRLIPITVCHFYLYYKSYIGLQFDSKKTKFPINPRKQSIFYWIFFGLSEALSIHHSFQVSIEEIVGLEDLYKPEHTVVSFYDDKDRTYIFNNKADQERCGGV